MRKVNPDDGASPGPRRGTATERPSIYDVAAAAGVSIGTVSRVLSGRNKEVWPSTLQRADHIRKVAAELGYSGASWRARAFARGQTRTVALVNVANHPFQMSEVYESFFSDLSDRFFELGYEMQVVPVSYAHAPRSLRLLTEQRYDGCVVVKKVTPDVEEAVRAASLPAVALNARAPRGWPSVTLNDAGGAAVLTRHLLELGHRHLAFVTYETPPFKVHQSYNDRIRGMQRTLEEAGAPPLTVLSGPVPESAARLVAQNPRPTAVVTFDDNTAIRWLQACWRVGLRIPADLSVATFNDSSQAIHAVPPLTVMRIPTREMAGAAADQLVAVIRGASHPSASRRQCFDLQLVTRESTAILPRV